MGALADRVPGDCGESGAECAEDVARSREALAQRLERVQPQLSKALALGKDPLLVPIGQDVPCERVRALADVVGSSRTLDEPERETDGGAQVDVDLRRELELLAVRLDGRDARSRSRARSPTANSRVPAPRTYPARACPRRNREEEARR